MNITGTSGNDLLTGSIENDTISGGLGSDTLRYNGLSTSYFVKRYSSSFTVQSWDTGEGFDTVSNDVEYLQFTDKKMRVSQPVFMTNATQILETKDYNNTAYTAQGLSVGTGLTAYKVSGSISSSSDRDLYRLPLDQMSDIEVSLEGQTANLSMRLWADLNQNGKADYGEYETEHQSGGANEYIFRSDRIAQDWYVEVWRTDGATSSNYQLGIAAQRSVTAASSLATDLGNISTGGKNWDKGILTNSAAGSSFVTGGTIGKGDTEDWYKFSVKAGGLAIDLNFADGYGDALLGLYKANADGTIGQQVALANNADIVNETLRYGIESGNYFLKVVDEKGLSDNSYSLNLRSTVNNTVSFDGVNDYLNIPLNVSETAFTVAFWFKSSTGGGLFSATQSNALTGGYDRNINLTSSSLTGRLYSEETITEAVNLLDNQWHHVAYTYGTGAAGTVFTQRLFIDGNLAVTGTKTASDFTAQGAVKFGYSVNSLLKYFKGEIDNISIWNRAMGATAIRGYMDSPLTGTESGLQGYWDFNNDTGTTVVNKVAGGINGTLVNGASLYGSNRF